MDYLTRNIFEKSKISSLAPRVKDSGECILVPGELFCSPVMQQ